MPNETNSNPPRTRLDLPQALLCLAILTAFSGCISLKPDAPADSGFLEHPGKMATAKYISARWVSEKYIAKKDDYTKIIVRPIITEYLIKTSDWKHIKVKSEDRIRLDAKELAKSMEDQLREGFQSGKAKKLTLVDSPDANTLVLEIALVELVPTDVVRTAAGDVAGFFVPGGGLASTGAGGSIAVEVRMRDAQTKEILAMAKDRRVDKISALDLINLTPYGHAKRNIEDWVEALIDWFNIPPEEEVELASRLTLVAW
jgi:hypothetical protein